MRWPWVSIVGCLEVDAFACPRDSASAFTADNGKNTPRGSVSGTRRVCADFLLKASLKAAQRMKVVM
jgi:hypothetical protein